MLLVLCSAVTSADAVNPLSKATPAENGAIAQLERRHATVKRDADGHATAVILHRSPRVNDRLDLLVQLPALQKLDVSGNRITDAGLVWVGKLTNLRELNLSSTVITDGGLAELKTLKRLTSLYLFSCRISDQGLAALNELPALEELNLSGTDVTDDGLPLLSDAPALRRLYLGWTKTTDVGMQHLGRLRELRELNLVGTKVTDAGLRQVPRLSQLTFLGLPVTVTDDGLAPVGDLRKLKRLWFTHVSLTGSGLRHLRGLPELAELRFSNARLEEAELQHLAELPRLKALEIAHGSFNDQTLCRLPTLPQLERFEISFCRRIKGEGLTCLKGMPNLRRLQLRGTALTDQGLAHIQSLARLEFLGLDQTRITDQGLWRMAAKRRLTQVSLQHTGITDTGLMILKEMVHVGPLNIKDLDLTGTKIRDKGVKKWLGFLYGLKRLKASRTDVSFSAAKKLVDQISGLKSNANRLTSALEIVGVKLQRDSSGRLVGATLPRQGAEGALLALAGSDLQELQLAGGPHWRKELPELAKMVSLRRLSLQLADLRDEDLQRLRPLVKLRRLRLGNARARLTASGMEQLSELSDLRSLDLTGSLDVNGARALSRLPNLRRLRLIGLTDADRVLPQLAALDKLETLIVRRADVSAAGLDGLPAIDKLRNLVLADNAKLDAAALLGLSRAKRLQYLDLSGTGVGDGIIETLAKLPALRQLNLQATPVTDAGLLRLRDAKQLRLLMLSRLPEKAARAGSAFLSPRNRVAFTAEGVRALREALPACAVLTVYRSYEQLLDSH